jgi:Family of unknown function (DUF5675)
MGTAPIHLLFVGSRRLSIPSDGFVILIQRLRNESRRSRSRTSYRTVGRYRCYFNGRALTSSLLKGATAEPRGPGNNGTTGTNRGLRIEAGTYQLGTHGFRGSKYHTFDYFKDRKPRPGVYVHDTNKRSAILIHQGSGFKASIGCINLTKSLTGPRDNVGINNSHKHLAAFIQALREKLSTFPTRPGRRIPKAWLVIEGEP